MKKANFIELLQLLSSVNKDIEVLERLGIDLQDSTITRSMDAIFSVVLSDIYDKEGLECILWYVYEKSLNPELKLGDLEIETPEDLYTYLEMFHNSKQSTELE